MTVISTETPTRSAAARIGIHNFQMKYPLVKLNLKTGLGIQKMMFPDGQPHIRLSEPEAFKEGAGAHIICAIRSSLELVQLMMIASAVEHAGGYIDTIAIPYFMGARYDRVINPGDSFDLEVVAGCVVGLNADVVVVFDPHSAVTHQKTLAACVTNEPLVKRYVKENAVLIVPDKGAIEKAKDYPEWNTNLTDIVFCNKSRDLETGKVTLTVQQPEKCAGRNCIIIDDICDGGATFKAIADQIEPAHLTLMVSHGIFSNGFSKLKEHFDEIITTDSYLHHATDKVTTVLLGDLYEEFN